MEKRARQAAALCAAPVFALAGAASADYQPGFLWHRATDWAPGTEQGGMVNNPGPDQLGSAVWGYEYVSSGGGFDSPDPWYLQDRTMMTWDDSWYGGPDGVWSRGDDASPPVYSIAFLHHFGGGQGQYIPTVRWENPVGDGAVVDISGDMTLKWSAGNGNAFPNDVDFMVAMIHGDSGDITPLFSETYQKPTQAKTTTETLDFTFALENVAFDAGDSLLITHRSHDDYPYGWVVLYDDVAINLVTVPAPGAFALLALGGIATLRRRR